MGSCLKYLKNMVAKLDSSNEHGLISILDKESRPVGTIGVSEDGNRRCYALETLRINLPEKHRTITTAANEGFPIRTKSNTTDPSSMIHQFFLVFTGVYIP